MSFHMLMGHSCIIFMRCLLPIFGGPFVFLFSKNCLYILHANSLSDILVQVFPPSGLFFHFLTVFFEDKILILIKYTL